MVKVYEQASLISNEIFEEGMNSYQNKSLFQESLPIKGCVRQLNYFLYLCEHNL